MNLEPNQTVKNQRMIFTNSHSKARVGLYLVSLLLLLYGRYINVYVIFFK